MNFHGGQGTEFAGEFFGFEGEGFVGRFAPDEFGGKAGDGDGGFAAEGLESGAVDHLLAAIFFELDPHAKHFAAGGIADSADGIGVGHFAHVLRILQGFADFLFEFGVHTFGWHPASVVPLGGSPSGTGGSPVLP